MTELDHIVKQLKLQPHPEGGFYKETYRSEGLITEDNLDNVIEGMRHYSTAIYFLLTSDNFSALHRIKQDEIWHFYKGSPLKLHIISPQGVYSMVIIGNHLEEAEVPQYTVAARSWFAAEVLNDNAYTLVGCTVSPGFDFRDFELADKENLCSKFPQHRNIIERLTRD
ncbi:cupin domain-containing protein [Aestuariivivens sediminicola]|uniref:cupin domain-containing protein n=1 Tax=Aestuariivivens sediminicola TaxID=2913560 RepID=UPI001F585404|nr:cupin domain-containing protein [Aestuariivivens sediminicola]